MSFRKIRRASLPLLGVWLLSATTANAVFLSADPVGTKDDPNLYLYVGLDPVNNTDPTGKTCVANASGESQRTTYTCRIDYVRDRGGDLRAPTNAERRQFASFERNYTRAVNQLMANPGRTASITIPGQGPAGNRSFRVNAGEVGQGLVRRQFIADPARAGGAETSRGFTTVYGDGLRGTNIPRSGGDTGRGQRILVVHEGIHRRPSENRMMIAPSLGVSPWSGAHQAPYNDAALGLLDED